MKIFGYELKKYQESKKRVPNPLLRMLLPSWGYGSMLTTEKDYSSLLKAFKSWVYVCASRNASSVAQSTLRLYVAKPNKSLKSIFLTKSVDEVQKEFLLSNSHINKIQSVKKAVDFEEVMEHPILDLISSVNTFMSSFDLWEITELYLELTGNAYWLILKNKAGMPVEIWPMPPDRVRIIPDKERFISGYEYIYGTYRKIFNEEDVIHFKFPNPENMYYGKSPLSAIVAEYNINESMNTYENAVFANMGRLEGAFETDESIDEEEFKRLKTEIQEAFYGARNAGKAPLLDKGLKYKNYGMTPREMAYSGGREKMKETILNAYGQSLGMYDKTSTRANAEAANYNFAKNTLQPRCSRLAERLNEKLIKYYDDRLFFAWDNVVPEDRDQLRQERVEYANAGIMTRNEIRKTMRMPPLKGHEQVWMQSQYIPNSLVLSGKTLPGNVSDSNTNTEPKVEPEKPSENEVKRIIDDMLIEIKSSEK